MKGGLLGAHLFLWLANPLDFDDPGITFYLQVVGAQDAFCDRDLAPIPVALVTVSGLEPDQAIFHTKMVDPAWCGDLDNTRLNIFLARIEWLLSAEILRCFCGDRFSGLIIRRTNLSLSFRYLRLDLNRWGQLCRRVWRFFRDC